MKQKKTSRKRYLAFLPAALIVGVVAAAAAGISVIPAATAADVTVTGSVAATLDIPANSDPGNNGTGGTCVDSGNDASFAIANGWENTATVTGKCTINFGSSNGQVELLYSNNNAGSTFYCNHPGGGARTCGTVNEVGNVAANQPITADTFGIAVTDTVTNGVAGTGFVEDNTPTAGESIWRPIPVTASPGQLCLSSAAGTSSCTFALGLRGKGAVPAQNNGNYDGVLRLTVDQL